MKFLHRLRQIIRNAARIARELMDAEDPAIVDALDNTYEPPNDCALPMRPFSCVVAPIGATGDVRRVWVMTGTEGQFVGFCGQREIAVDIVAEMLLAELRESVLPDEVGI